MSITFHNEKILIAGEMVKNVQAFRKVFPQFHWDGRRELWYAYIDPGTIQAVNTQFGAELDYGKYVQGIRARATYQSDIFKTEPYEHQMEALRRSYGRPYYGFFMDPGLGKTKVVVDEVTALSRAGEIQRVVIVCPKTVVGVWIREIERHGADYGAWDIQSWTEGTIHKAKGQRTVSWFIINIDALKTAEGWPVIYKFIAEANTYMAIDESTTIKNIESERTKRALRLRLMARYARILTGTPIANTPLDLYSQFYFLDPEIVYDWEYSTFVRHFAITGGYKHRQIFGFRNKEELSKMLHANGYRISKEQAVDLPPKIYLKRELELQPKARKIYDRIWDEEVIPLAADSKASVAIIITKMLKAQQVCGGFVKDDDGAVHGTGTEKYEEVLNILAEVSGKTAIWCQFLHEIAYLSDRLRSKGHIVVTVYGDVKTHQRTFAVNRFENGDADIIILQNQTGGLGITLNAASNAIFYSNYWTPEVRSQAEDRHHRIGQTKSVTYFDLVVKNTMDTLIMRALQKKQSLVDMIVGAVRQKTLNSLMEE